MEERTPVDLHYYRTERPSRSVPGEKREPQVGPASGLSNPAPENPKRRRGRYLVNGTQQTGDRQR